MNENPKNLNVLAIVVMQIHNVKLFITQLKYNIEKGWNEDPQLITWIKTYCLNPNNQV